MVGARRTVNQNAGMRTVLLSFLLACSAPISAAAADNGWSFYGGDAGGTRYSSLKQITRENVAKLKAVWTYHTGALSAANRSQRQGRLRGHADSDRWHALSHHAVQRRDRARPGDRRREVEVRSQA